MPQEGAILSSIYTNPRLKSENVCVCIVVMGKKGQHGGNILCITILVECATENKKDKTQIVETTNNVPNKKIVLSYR